MSELLRHNCGLTYVHATNAKNHATPLAIAIAENLGNRGQDAAGIGLLTPQGFEVHKRHGRVDHGILRECMYIAKAIAVMIHNRYKTSGSDALTLAAAQPFDYGVGDNRIGFMHNGEVLPDPLLHYLKKEQCNTSNMISDSDAIGRCLYHLLLKHRLDIVKALHELWPMLDGGHNGVMQLAKRKAAPWRAVAWRDERGTHPLFLGEYEGNDGMYNIVSSEDNAIYRACGNNLKRIQEIFPGEYALFPHEGRATIKQITKSTLKKSSNRQTPAHCIFEWIYFMKRLSSMAGVQADAVRTRAGEALAKQDKEWLANRVKNGKKKPFVAAIPRTAIPMANGYKDKSGLRLAEPILRNPDAERTFILPDDQRDDAMEKKFDFDTDVLLGRDVILVDDSLVRSKTIKAIVKKLRKKRKGQEKYTGEIHVRIGFPMVYAPCFYGIDMKTLDELFGTKYRKMFEEGKSLHEVEDAMAKELGVQSLRFLPSSKIAEVVQIPDGHLCHGCTDADYPTPTGEKLYQLQLDTRNQAQATICA